MNTETVAALIIAGIPALYLLLSARSARRAFKQVDIMTESEREFFIRMNRAVPEMFIFPRVSMAALFATTAAKGSKKYLFDFALLSQRSVDFAVFDFDMRLICVVDLEDSTHDLIKDHKRNSILNHAGIQTIRWDSRNKPDVREIQERVYSVSGGKQ